MYEATLKGIVWRHLVYPEQMSHTTGDSGFVTLQHFCSVFKAETGVSPSEFRRKRLAQSEARQETWR